MEAVRGWVGGFSQGDWATFWVFVVFGVLMVIACIPRYRYTVWLLVTTLYVAMMGLLAAGFAITLLDLVTPYELDPVVQGEPNPFDWALSVGVSVVVILCAIGWFLRELPGTRDWPEDGRIERAGQRILDLLKLLGLTLLVPTLGAFNARLFADVVGLDMVPATYVGIVVGVINVIARARLWSRPMELEDGAVPFWVRTLVVSTILCLGPLVIPLLVIRLFLAADESFTMAVTRRRFRRQRPIAPGDPSPHDVD